MLDIRVNTRSPIPLYHQIYEQLRDYILRGILRPGDRLPTEQELSEHCGVSRMTARAALTQLAQEGLVERRQGRGTFVAQPKATLEQISFSLVNFTQFIEMLGRRSRTQTLEQGVVPASPDVAHALKLEPGDQVLQILRIRYADDIPMAIDSSYFPLVFLHEIANGDTQNPRLREVLEEELHRRMMGSENILELSVAGPLEANLLGVSEGIPMVRYTRVIFDDQNQPLEFTRILVRGDRFRAVVRRMRDAQQPVSQISSHIEGTIV